VADAHSVSGRRLARSFSVDGQHRDSSVRLIIPLALQHASGKDGRCIIVVPGASYKLKNYYS
jgi:hypothetical protein